MIATRILKRAVSYTSTRAILADSGCKSRKRDHIADAGYALASSKALSARVSTFHKRPNMTRLYTSPTYGWGYKISYPALFKTASVTHRV